MAQFSIIGAYNFMPSIFDGLQLPEALDRSTAINNILMECAELELLYSDLDFFKFAIEQWSSKQLSVWQKLYETTQLKYDPIENFNRKEEYTDSSTVKRTENVAETAQSSSTNKSNGTSSSAVDSSQDNEERVSAYDSDTYQPKGKNTLSGNEKRSATDTVTDTGNASGENERQGEFSEQHSFTHSAREYGNIGVTTSQQMIEAEREVVKFNIYDYITDDFKSRFCLLVY